MTHPRKAIRAAFKARLTGTGPSYATVAHDRVFDTMTPPIEVEGTIVNEGPVLMVYARHEEMREEDYPNARENGGVRRRLDISIEVIAAGANVDDELDDAAEQIEGLIESWDIPGFPSAEVLLLNSQIDVSDTQDRIVGGLFMTYHVKYWAPYRETNDPDFLPNEVFSRPQDRVAGSVISELIVNDADGPVQP